MGYLGNDLNSSVVVSKTRKTFAFNATSANQTIFTGADKVGQILDCLEGDHVFVFANGVLLLPVDDYTVGAGRITLVLGADLNDEITISTDPEAILYDGYTKSEIDGKIVTVNTAMALKVGMTSATGAATLPVGTTSQRPASPTNGMIRHNIDNSTVETFDGTQWISVGDQSAPYAVQYLVIGGGAGGGTQSAGGGGAGGYRSSVSGELSGGGNAAESPLTVTPKATYTITIGAGGAGTPAGGSADRPLGTSGSNSVFSTITALGGGGGSSYRPNGSGVSGASGGSGGGGGIWYGTGGAGTSGQGYVGGQGGLDDNSIQDVAGGGGGAGSAGKAYNDGNTAIRGDGGIGVQSSINGTATYRAGGGGGATHNGAGGPGDGGNGGGGAGGNTNSNGANGTTNTGGGGGGGSEYNNIGGSGGSGVVIIRYTGVQRGTGGTVTNANGYTIHTFTSSGTFTA